MTKVSKFKFLFGILTVVLASMSVAINKSKAADIVAILTCPMGCGVMEGNTLLGTIMAKAGDELIVASQETPGYMYNVRAMTEKRRWKKQVFGTEDVIIQLAMQGGSPELEQFLPEKIPTKFKLLFGEAYWAQGKFFVSTDPSIKTVSDMKGKRISIGMTGQSDWGVFPYLLLKYGYGIDETNSDIRRLNPGGLTQQLIDGTTDVAVTGYGTDTLSEAHLITGPLRKLEASGKTLNYIGIDEEAIEKVNAKFGTTFLTKTIKAGTLPGQTSDLVSGFNRGYKAAHPEFPEKLAYQLVMAAHKHAPELRRVNKLWALMTDSMMTDGLTEENTHPGAIRAYKELGIWENRKGTVPVTYPN